MTYSHYIQTKESSTNNLSAISEILSVPISEALVSDTTELATITLEALSRLPSIKNACIYTNKNLLFSSYSRANSHATACSATLQRAASAEAYATKSHTLYKQLIDTKQVGPNRTIGWITLTRNSTTQNDMDKKILAYIAAIIAITILIFASKLLSQIPKYPPKRMDLAPQFAGRMEATRALSAKMAHDFNNIFGVIHGYGELLLHSLGQENASKKYARQILAAEKKGVELTNLLLSYTKVNSSSPEAVPINKALLNLRKTLEHKITKTTTLHYALNPNDALILVDANDFECTVISIIQNAVDAIQRRGHSSTGGKSYGQLHILTSVEALNHAKASGLSLKTGHYVKLSIIDNGNGIDADILERIFEPFFTTKQESSAGLGLTLVYGFMMRCSGGIQVYSDGFSRSEFNLYFPIVAREPLDIKPARLS